MDAGADAAVSALPPAFQAPEEAASRCRGASNTGGVKYSICTFCTSKASKLSTAPTCEQMQESIDYGRRQVLRWRQRQYSYFCASKASKLSTSVHFCIKHKQREQREYLYYCTSKARKLQIYLHNERT